MFKAVGAFCGFSVNNLEAAKKFYGETLELTLKDEKIGLRYELPGGGQVFIYQKEDHQPAVYTVLNFVVNDIDAAVDELDKQGVNFEKYEGFNQDEKGIARPPAGSDYGPPIAWFKDPTGNILSVIQQ